MIPERYSAYEKTVTVACVNFGPVAGDTAATLAKLEANVVEAASQGAQIIVFPEEALVGASFCGACRDEGGPCAQHLAIAETVPGPSTERVAELARQYDAYVVFGLAERDATDDTALYNAAAVVGPDGVMGTYRKLHLGALPWVSEGITFRPGTALPIWETRFGPIGVQICYDFWLNPELSRLQALKGARVLINCSASFAGPGKREYFVHTTQTRATENLVYAASANLAGLEVDRDSYAGDKVADTPRAAAFSGHSTIAGPAFPRFNQIYAEAEEGEEIVSATLSFDKLHRWEAVFPWRDWRRGRQKAISDLIASEFANLT